MATLIADPSSLSDMLAKAQPNDLIQLRGGDYPGIYALKAPGVTLEPYSSEPARFTGPPAPPTDTSKPAWLRIWPTAKGASISNLLFERSGDIEKAKAFNDYGIFTSADNVTIQDCTFAGMRIGVTVQGTSLRSTIVYNHFGPTYQSNIAIGTSGNVIRALLIAWNIFEQSYIEDGIQWHPQQTGDTSSPEHLADISNLGTIVYGNEFHDINENALDLKGAALVVVDGNIFIRTAGSVDGPLNGWNHKSPATIMRGSNASSRDVIIRNNLVENNSSGIRVYEGYHIYHNRVVDNNYSPEGTYDGFGISQISKDRSAIKNNLVSGNRQYDVAALAGAMDVDRNPPQPGPGVPLTFMLRAGVGNEVSILDAGYFTDWFGRKDLPPDCIFVDGQEAVIEKVDYANNRLVLDRILSWTDHAPVCWLSPKPVVGIQEAYELPPIVVEPPPIEPLPPTPTPDETVRLVLETTMNAADAAQLRALLISRDIKVSLADAELPPGSVTVYDPGDDE